MSKTITQHRALAFILQERIVSCYEKMIGKPCTFLDEISGKNGWCDFTTDLDWGEVVFIHQPNLPFQWTLQSLFSVDIEKFEEKYGIRVNPNTIPDRQQEVILSPTIVIDSQVALKEGIRKKLQKTYPHHEKGFARKGTLILSLLDVSFEGFIDNSEIKMGLINLQELRALVAQYGDKSSFNRILLVDGLRPFHEYPQRDTYLL